MTLYLGENLKSRLENLERQAAEIQELQNASPGTATSQPQVIDLTPQATETPAASMLDDNAFDFLLDINTDGGVDQNLPVDTEAFEFSNYPISMFPNMETIFDTSTPAELSSSSNAQTSNPSIPTPDVDFEYDLYLNELSSGVPPPKDPPNQFSQVRDGVGWAPWVPNRAWAAGKSPVKAIDNFVRLVPDANTVSKVTIRPGRRSKTAEKQDDIVKLPTVGTTFARSLVQQLRLDDSNENKSLVKTAIARGYNIRDVFLAGLGALDKRETLQPRMGFDPSKNTLTLVPTSTLQAYLSNAMALKLPIKGLKNEEFQSPFYQPEALASGNMAPLEAIWNDLPKALRPVRGQITIPHHPWMVSVNFSDCNSTIQLFAGIVLQVQSQDMHFLLLKPYERGMLTPRSS